MRLHEKYKMTAHWLHTPVYKAYVDGFNRALKLADEIHSNGPVAITMGRIAAEKRAEGSAIMWNDGNKVVQDHRDGTIIQPDTDIERSKRGLPVPWTMDADLPKGGAL